MQKSMEIEQLSGISALHQQNKPFAIGGLVKKNWKKKITIFRDFKGQFGFINQEFFFSLALQSLLLG